MNTNEWKEYYLSEIMDIIGGGTPKTSNPDYWDGPIPWISVTDFVGDKKFITSTEKSITSNGLENSSTKLLHKGQLIISARGTVGELGVITSEMAFNQSCYGLNAKEPTTNDFLYYLLKYNLTKLKQNTHGAVFDTITRDTFDTVKVKLPPLPEQKRIAGILGSLDDKIELNRRMNETLESIARAIFKSWFVDFNPVRAKMEGRQPFGMDAETAALFPDHFEDSPLGPIPAGWRVGTIAEVTDNYDNKRIPLSAMQREKRKGIYPYYGAASIMDFIDDYIFDGDYILAAEDGSVIDGEDHPIIQFAHGKFWVNNHTHVLQAKGMISNEFLLLFLKQLNIRPYITGAVQPKINQANLNSIPFLIPGSKIILTFNNDISLVYKLIDFFQYQNLILEKIRNLLLRKLLT